MASESKPDAELIQRIIQTYLGCAAERIVDRSPGYSGSFVYAVDVIAPAGSLPCIVKLISDESDDEDVTNRVYGSRAASFTAAYALPSGSALALPGGTPVTDQTYLRHDGDSDSTIDACDDDGDTTTAGGNRQQNEPSVAINPTDPSVIVAGANDYCTVPSTTDAWMGFYVSTDGGTTWTDSLNPGYPGDTSEEGMASPIFGRAVAAGDPIMDWDNENRLFYGGISFNRTNPSNGDVHVST